MKIGIASDHAGSKTRALLAAQLDALGHEIVDFGPDEEGSVDYPDYALKVARAVAAGEVERGILCCGTGLGMSIAANKVRGIRAVAPYDRSTAEMSRKHNDANVVCFGERTLPAELIAELTKIWLETEFEGDRHSRRIDKIADAES